MLRSTVEAVTMDCPKCENRLQLLLEDTERKRIIYKCNECKRELVFFKADGRIEMQDEDNICNHR